MELMETICLKTSHHKYTTHADLIGRQYYTTVANVTAKWKNKIDAAIVERYDTNVGGPSALRDKRRTPDDDKSFMQTEERLRHLNIYFGDDNISNSTRVLAQRVIGLLREDLVIYQRFMMVPI